MLGGRWLQKPPPGTPIDRFHALCPAVAYPLNEGSGAVCRDSLGSSHTLTVGANTVTWSSGQYGPCLHFDGAGYVTATNPLALAASVAAPFSILVRYRLSTGNSGTPGIMSIGTGSADTAPAQLVQLNGSSGIRCLTGDVSYQTVTTNVTPGQWHTVISASTSNVSSTITQYFDGIQVQTMVGTYAGTDRTSLYLGSGYNGGCICDIDCVLGWNLALTQGQAATITYNPWQIYSPPAFGWLAKAAAGASFRPWIYGDQIEASGLG